MTGAGSGIGAAIATKLGKCGYHVVVTDVDQTSSATTAKRIDSAQAVKLDVTDPDDCERVVKAVVAEHERLEVRCSNAGVSKMQRFLDISPADLKWKFDINTFGVFYWGQSVARAMIELGAPDCIVNTASMTAKDGSVSFLADYIANKFAVLGLT